MALERGDVTAIVKAVQDTMGAQLEARIEALESRPAITADPSDGPVIGRVEQLEAAIGEIIAWSQTVQQAVAGVVQQGNETQAALVRVLGGGSTAEWRAFVVRECVRLGVGPREVAQAMRNMGGAEDGEEAVGDDPGRAD